MRIFLFFLLVAGIGFILFQYIRTTQFIRIGTELSDRAIPFSRPLPQATLKILVLGDSTGVGVGASSPEFSPAGLTAKRYPDAHIVNASVSGARMRDAVKQLSEIKETDFDLVMIHIGGNDAIRFTNNDEFAKDFAELMAQAKEKGDYVLVTSTGDIGTVPLFPFGSRWIFALRGYKIREIMKAEVARHDSATVRYTDLLRERALDPFALDPTHLYAEDKFHPSDAGYADWFSLMSKELDAFPIK
ncbi:SGNH/GDSL hydrolase family protein [Patescibacteria group bacterium]|nr:SGNH/GDSL hydrolase family protein [Patescibacteria group bacterium]